MFEVGQIYVWDGAEHKQFEITSITGQEGDDKIIWTLNDGTTYDNYKVSYLRDGLERGNVVKVVRENPIKEVKTTLGEKTIREFNFLKG